MSCQHTWIKVNRAYEDYQCSQCEMSLSVDEYDAILQARREGWEQAKKSSQRTIQQLEAMNKALMEQLAKGVSMQPSPIMIANSDTHRMGWEQAKREAVNKCQSIWLYNQNTHKHTQSIGMKVCYDAIAAMEYGGKANDRY